MILLVAETDQHQHRDQPGKEGGEWPISEKPFEATGASGAGTASTAGRTQPWAGPAWFVEPLAAAAVVAAAVAEPVATVVPANPHRAAREVKREEAQRHNWTDALWHG